MGCRYCGKELALLKRLTGGGEFCSEAHKRSYQDEYNRLALSRLLQAQKVNQGEPAGKRAGTSVAPVAVEEPSPEAAVMDESAFAGRSLEATTAVENALPDESPDTGAGEMPEMESAPIEIGSLEGSGAEEAAVEDAPVEAEPEPTEIAEFLIDAPAMAMLPDETPYLESWLELSSGPAVADWQLQGGNGANTLSTAALLSLDLQLNASPGVALVQQPGPEASLTPPVFAASRPGQPSLPWKVSAMRQLPYASPLRIEVGVTVTDFAPDQGITAGVDFETAVSPQDSALLSLACTAIEFPAEDSDVELIAGENQVASVDLSVAEPEPVMAEDASPRASLEALSKLHQDLIHEEEAAPPEVVANAGEEPVPVVAQVVEPPVSHETAAAPHARPATELVDLAIRIFPPAKPAPIAGAGLPSQSEPLLPHLKSLPLRPKVAVASGYAPPSATHPARTVTSGPKPAPLQATAAHAGSAGAPHKEGAPAAPSKFAPASKPAAARIAQPKQPPAPGKVEGAVKASAPAGKAQPPAHPAASKAAAPSPARLETQSVKADAAPSAPSPAPHKETPAIAASAKASQEAKKVSEPPASTKSDAKPAVKPHAGEPAEESVPNFGAMQQPSGSFAGSLKVKLGIAIVILVVACSTWLGWGGKSGKPAAPNSATSTDGSGPSIIMGEGGWVEGWAGDPSGVHACRQITIYRPSLKLSDYRIEFQGNIETQSIGWVFRAADPDNYYALKLSTVSSGLSSKVALFKYLVINGRQTQVGRVPIDLAVQADTVFNIRTDVRGPQFTTSIQGRQVDVWTDDQLKTGGVGFLNERDERGKVKSVSIRYLNGAVK